MSVSVSSATAALLHYGLSLLTGSFGTADSDVVSAAMAAYGQESAAFMSDVISSDEYVTRVKGIRATLVGAGTVGPPTGTGGARMYRPPVRPAPTSVAVPSPVGLPDWMRERRDSMAGETAP